MSDEKRQRNQRRNLDVSGRDQRIFSSSLRSVLGGQKPRNRRGNEAPREVKPSLYQSIDEALKELDKALEQPSTSLQEFDSYIRHNVRRFGEQECQETASKLIEYVLKSGEYWFLLKICSDCIRHLNLMDAIAQELLLRANEYFLNGEIDKQSIPELFGHIIAAKWPPGKGKALESVNPVLFVGLNIVLSWIGVMRIYSQTKPSSSATTPDDDSKGPSKKDSSSNPPNFYSSPNASNSSNFPNSSNSSKDDHDIQEGKDSGDSADDDHVVETKEGYDEKTAALASISVYSVCNIAQRNFWLNFMETFDDVFMVTKQLLINPEARLPRRVKESLLQLYLSLFKWSSTNQPKFTSTSTQT